MVDDIIRMARKLRKYMQANISILEEEIDLMIKNKEKSPEKIEKMLDAILNYLQMGIGKDQFMKLNSYYGSFCPENSAAYQRFYKEMIEE